MPQSAHTIIALSPGGKEFGVAVFEDADLLYYAIKDLGQHRQGNTAHSLAREAVRMTEDIVHKYQPAHMVVRALHPLQQLSPTLSHMAERLKDAGGRQGLTVRECEPKEAREHLCPYARATRRNAAAHLANLYPELARYLTNVTLWQRLYYERMFDAIAIGYYCQQAAEKERERRRLSAQDAGRLPQVTVTNTPTNHSPHANHSKSRCANQLNVS